MGRTTDAGTSFVTVVVEAKEPLSDSSLGWKLLRTALLEQKRGLLLGVMVGVFWAAGKVSVPQLTKMGIDRGIEGRESLWFWSGLVVGAGVIAGIFTSLRRWHAFRESRWIETRLREKIFDHLLHLHVGYHDGMQTGQIMSRASSDLQQLQAFVVMIPITLSNLVMVIAIVVLLISSQPVLALVALSPLPVVTILASRFSRDIHPVVLEVQQEQAQLATVVEESVAGVRVIKGFGAEKVQANKLLQEADDIWKVSLIAAKIRSRFLPALDLLPSLGLIAVLGIGGHRVINDQMSVGDLVKFNAYITMLIWPLRNLAMTVALGQRASVALMRVNEVLNTPSLITDPVVALELPSGSQTQPVGQLQFNDVIFGYGDNAPIIDDFNLSVAPGSAVALVGATGSGKSTIVRLLTRFHDVQRGSIKIDGVDIRSLSLNDLRTAVGIVFEETFLFHDSVFDNIAFAQPDASPQVVERAAKLAGAHDFILELPHGYATILGERGYSLSGGQRQRIAIARAIVSDPRILVLDDATSAVDPSKEHEIRQAMATVMKGRTTIVIAHRAGTIALADSVVLLDGGRVVALGTHEELLLNDERYQKVLAGWQESDGDSEVDN
jgi:ATP-binding cassette, subfamily B, bacterial